MRLILIGAPGAGKGTQAISLCEILGVPHLSTGDIFRYNIKNETELGLKVKEIINRGNFVSDQITNEIVADRLRKDDCAKGFILDGYPRNVSQSLFLEDFLKLDGKSIDFVINVKVSDEEIISRMSGRRVCEGCGATFNIVNIKPKIKGVCDNCGDRIIQRIDDLPETVAQRLTIYHEQTEPVIEFYRKKKLLVDIDGVGNPVDTTENILKTLGVENAIN